MKAHVRILCLFILCAAVAPAFETPPSAAAKPVKNWTPPGRKIYAQALSEQVMALHPELLSITFHGVPPGLSKTYTMFAGSYPDRIGNPDDPDDVMVIELGITIIDPRWHRANDTVRKFVLMMPLRDNAGENIGLLVLAYKNDKQDSTSGKGMGEREFFTAASDLRDALQKEIPDYAALFDPAK